LKFYDKIKQIKEEEKIVRLIFKPINSNYIAMIREVGDDYIEFDVLGSNQGVISRNILPLKLLSGIIMDSMDLVRERLEKNFSKEVHKD